MTNCKPYPAYKDSGVSWLGEVPESWGVKPGFTVVNERKEKNIGLKEKRVLSLSYGKVIIKPEEKLTGLVPESFETYQLVFPGDVIIRPTDLQNDHTSLRTGLAKDQGIITSAYINLRVKNGNSRFYHYFLHAIDLNKVLYGLGSGLRQNIDFSDFKRFPFVIPPTVEQAAIADFLDDKTAKIDKAIAQKQQLIALLKERKQIIIQNAVTKGLDPKAKMKDSGIEWIGEIPEHWEVKQARYLFRVVNRSGRNGTEVKYSVTQKSGLIPTDEMKENSTQAVSFDSFQLCFEGDLVLNKYKAHLGVFWKAPSRGIITNNYTVFRPLGRNLSDYFEILFHSPKAIRAFRTIVYGVTEGMAPLYTGDFYQMKFVCPPPSEQLEIVSEVRCLEIKFGKAESSLVSQIQKLREYRATLIDSAVTGKIKVPGV